MQGFEPFIPTEIKADYINCLLKAGFDILDFGSFVSPKAIPQLRDTAEVVKKLDLSSTHTKLLAIIGNLKGAQNGSVFDEITYFAYPLSTSPTFLKKNLNTTVEQAFASVEEIQNLCIKTGKELLVYLSMAFGNPYSDEHSDEMIYGSIDKLDKLEIKKISFADTLGTGDISSIGPVFSNVLEKYKHIDFGVHLHTKKTEAYERIDAACKAGCRFFDTAILGIGGCPMSGEELVGNLSTEQLIEYMDKNNLCYSLNKDILFESVLKAKEIFHIFE